MAEEMMLENVPWESDEAEDWESDEAIAEADESAEDIGERARRRRRSYYQPSRGVRGIALRAPDGSVRNVPFPTKLATAQETNRGLAKQEIARRALEKRLDRLAMQPKNESSVSGLVTLTIGGGLTVWGAMKASEKQAFTFANWANNENTQMAAVISASQLATTGAKLAINGRYHRSSFGIAADAFAALQLAAFVFSRIYTPSLREVSVLLSPNDSLDSLPPHSFVVIKDDLNLYEIEVIKGTGQKVLVHASSVPA
jgi:hypothetical protein